MKRVKKDDMVVILTGKDKGKRGSIIAISTKKGKVKVRGVAIMTRHVKARKQGEASMIKKEEAYIDLSNVMPICPRTDKPSRVCFPTSSEGKKSRVFTISKD